MFNQKLFDEQADAEIDAILKANARDWEELVSQPSTENKNGVYRDPRHYEKTGERQYRVNEMRYDNHTVFRAEYLIPGDDRWHTFNELQTLEALHGILQATPHNAVVDPTKLAGQTYLIADAMLDERQKYK